MYLSDGHIGFFCHCAAPLVEAVEERIGWIRDASGEVAVQDGPPGPLQHMRRATTRSTMSPNTGNPDDPAPWRS